MKSWPWVITTVVVVVLAIVIIISQLRQTPVISTCPVGQCPTSIVTGEKDCSRSDYDPLSEVCNLPQQCGGITPFPLNADLSTKEGGICVTPFCRCMRNPSCPWYISAKFSPSYDQVVITGVEPPGGYCTISSSSLTELGCHGSVNQCMSYNPCSAGQLAFMGNPYFLNSENLDKYPLACVKAQGSGLSSNDYYIWDDQIGDMVVKTVA